MDVVNFKTMKEHESSQFDPDIRGRVLSEISMQQWTDSTPVDQLQTYLQKTVRSTRVQTFGPTAGSDQVLMQGRLTSNLKAQPIIEGRATHRLSWAGEALMRELPSLQITHRSRPAGLMSSRLQMNELKRRVERAQDNMSTLDSISLPPNIAEEINSIKRNALLKRLKLDKPTLDKYIKEHEDSSIVSGVKWSSLVEMDDSFWSEYFNVIKGNAEEHFFSGDSYDKPFNLGARQRGDQQVHPEQIHYDLEVTRTRVIMFKPALSSVFAFVPDKLGFYQEVIEGAMDVMEINDHLLTPMTHGGEVYGAASEGVLGNEDSVIILGDDCNIFQKGEQFAFDGVNWETQVGTILGKPFHGSKTYFGGMYHVPSGVYDTSLDDSLATMWVYSRNPDMRKGVGIPDIMEREELDEATNFMLGMAYAYDPVRPRLQGLKLTQDNSKSGTVVPLPTGRNIELVSKKPFDEQERWYYGYHGTTPDGGSLLDFLQKVRPEDFRGGEVSELIENGFETI